MFRIRAPAGTRLQAKGVRGRRPQPRRAIRSSLPPSLLFQPTPILIRKRTNPHPFVLRPGKVEELFSLEPELLAALTPVFGLVFLFKWQVREGAAAAGKPSSAANNSLSLR